MKALNADFALHEAKRKQRELDEFKALPPEEQQIILEQKRAHEELLKQDLAVRVRNSLAAEEEPLEADMGMDAPENPAIGAVNPNQ